MKSICSILTILMLATPLALAQEEADVLTLNVFDHSLEKTFLTKYQHDPFFLLQSLYSKENLNTQNWENLLSGLDRQHKKGKDIRLLYNIFTQSQKTLLKDYRKFAYFNQTLEDGVYDCVTGSAVLGILLDRYSIPYQIVETASHVFVLGDFAGLPFIFEITLPEDGFILGEENVTAFLSNFDVSVSTDEGIHPLEVGNISTDSSYRILGMIGLRELAGLQYYNEAVRHFLDNEYPQAYIHLIKAEALYPSGRIVEFKEKMGQLVQVSERR
jgi:hypothetical protein